MGRAAGKEVEATAVELEGVQVEGSVAVETVLRIQRSLSRCCKSHQRRASLQSRKAVENFWSSDLSEPGQLAVGLHTQAPRARQRIHLRREE